jgi:alkyl hydroperoxide reductase subunit AhpF
MPTTMALLLLLVIVFAGLQDYNVPRMVVVISALVVVSLSQQSGTSFIRDTNNFSQTKSRNIWQMLKDTNSESNSDDHSNNIKHLPRRSSSSSVVWDVLIVGGSNAGLSAALSLGRSIRRVLVVDASQPCNRFSIESTHNLLGFDGVPSSVIAQRSRDNVAHYPTVQIWDQAVVQRVVTPHQFNEGDRFVATISRQQEDDGEEGHSKHVVYTRSLILATGVTDILPNSIPGLSECWGKSVIHCPLLILDSGLTESWESGSDFSQVCDSCRASGRNVV